MFISLENEVSVFLYALAGGMFVASVYDFFRIRRKVIKSKSIFIYIEDILFWVLVSGILLFVVFYSNEGEIRGYIFIGIITGVMIYSLLFSRIVTFVVIFVLKALYRLIWVISMVLSYPIKVAFRILVIPTRWVVFWVRKLYRRIKRDAKACLADALQRRKRFKNSRNKI